MKKIIFLIKRIIPMGILFRLRYITKFICAKKICKKSNKEIYYIDAPHYANLGDQAIAIAISHFARNYFSDYEFVEICQDEFPCYSSDLKKKIRKDDIIFLTGGGNFGNIYYMYEATRRYIITHFKENKIIIFPQTIEFTKDIFGKNSAWYSKIIYGNKKNLILCAREKKTYEIMKKLYKNTSVLLIPDIVMYLLYSPYFEKEVPLNKEYIGVCIRDDRESKLTDEEHRSIINIIQNYKINIRSISTISSIADIDSNNREKLFIDKLREIGKSYIVITDRLHAMIFCLLTDTPCVVFDNANGKISGVYQWMKDYPTIKLINRVDELNLYLDKITRKAEELNLSKYYFMLSEYIKKGEINAKDKKIF